MKTGKKTFGEFEFIDILKKDYANSKLNVKKLKKILSPLGDDCFCFSSGSGKYCVTKDMLIEDVHFKREWITPRELGRKAVEVNVSDLASMGNAEPEYIFVGLGVPENLGKEYIMKLYSGIKAACAGYGLLLAGGDTVSSGKIIISVTVIGSIKGKIIQRSGAKNGDFICVTNTFGDSGAGLALLTKQKKYNKNEKYLISKHNNPKARLEEAKKISKYANSMTDASDGLFISVQLITGESKKGADIYIEQIPLSKQLQSVFKGIKEQTNLALSGAEDYELVFTIPEKEYKKLKKLVPCVTCIGKINNSTKVRYLYNGKEQKTGYSGFKHF